MSLLDVDFDTFEISLYYKFVKVGSSKKLVLLTDEEAEKQMEDEDKEVVIEKITTNWRSLNWKEQNEVMSKSSKIMNVQTGESQFDFMVYRDSIIKKCLKSWDIVSEDQPVPLTPEAIDRLPGQVVLALYDKFEKANDYSEEEVKN